MKRYIAVLGLMLGLSAVVRAGTPQEVFFQGQPPLSNTSIYGSTFTVPGTANADTSLNAYIVPPTVNGVSCRNCFTKFFVQMPTNTVVNIIDGTSTSTVIIGSALGAASATAGNSLSLPEDHLGPLCMTPGSTTQINAIVGTPAFSAATFTGIAVNWEGYTNCGGTNNAGVLK